MRHLKGNKKLNKPTDQRLALLKSLALSLFKSDKIKTTDLRAKEASKLVSRIITLAKDGTLHSRRQAIKILPQLRTVEGVFPRLADRYKDREGGYTRITKVGLRKGDAATVSLLELI